MTLVLCVPILATTKVDSRINRLTDSNQTASYTLVDVCVGGVELKNRFLSPSDPSALFYTPTSLIVLLIDQRARSSCSAATNNK